MNVADDVERPVLLLQIIPQRLPLDHSGFNFLQRFQNMHMTETLALQPTQRAMQLLRLLANDVRTEIPVGACLVSVVRDPFRQI